MNGVGNVKYCPVVERDFPLDPASLSKEGGWRLVLFPQLEDLAASIKIVNSSLSCFSQLTGRCVWIRYGNQRFLVNQRSLAHRLGFTLAEIRRLLDRYRGSVSRILKDGDWGRLIVDHRLNSKFYRTLFKKSLDYPANAPVMQTPLQHLSNEVALSKVLGIYRRVQFPSQETFFYCRDQYEIKQALLIVEPVQQDGFVQSHRVFDLIGRKYSNLKVGMATLRGKQDLYAHVVRKLWSRYYCWYARSKWGDDTSEYYQYHKTDEQLVKMCEEDFQCCWGDLVETVYSGRFFEYKGVDQSWESKVFSEILSPFNDPKNRLQIESFLACNQSFNALSALVEKLLIKTEYHITKELIAYCHQKKKPFLGLCESSQTPSIDVTIDDRNFSTLLQRGSFVAARSQELLESSLEVRLQSLYRLAYGLMLLHELPACDDNFLTGCYHGGVSLDHVFFRSDGKVFFSNLHLLQRMTIRAEIAPVLTLQRKDNCPLDELEYGKYGAKLRKIKKDLQDLWDIYDLVSLEKVSGKRKRLHEISTLIKKSGDINHQCVESRKNLLLKMNVFSFGLLAVELLHGDPDFRYYDLMDLVGIEQCERSDFSPAFDLREDRHLTKNLKGLEKNKILSLLNLLNRMIDINYNERPSASEIVDSLGAILGIPQP